MIAKTCWAAALTIAAICSLAALSWGVTLERVDVSSTGEQADGASYGGAVSADGRCVAFISLSDELVPDDTNGEHDAFVRDRATGVTSRVSVSSEGVEANGWSTCCDISADGRYVAFESGASNLVPGDTNGMGDIFVHDCITGQTERVSIASDGAQGNGQSHTTSISADGCFIAFRSFASNLVPGDTNGGDGIFVHDRLTGQTTRVSVASDGAEADDQSFCPSISGDGRYVVFFSWATNLVADDSNGESDVFVHDCETGQTVRVSVSSHGEQGNRESEACSISPNGRYVAFSSLASNLVEGDTNGVTDIFLHDRETGATTRVSVASDGSQANYPSYIDDGMVPRRWVSDALYVVFASYASNLVPGDTNESRDIFLRDVARGRTTRVSISATGVEANGVSWSPHITPDGRFVSFVTDASNLAPGDTNNSWDVFLRDRLTFPDVPLDHWAFYEVGGCSMAGIVQGYPDGLYHPAFTIARDQMAVYIARALSGGAVPTGPAQAAFPDVPTDHWAFDEVEYTVANNVVQGYDDGKYHPDWELTRAQMAVFIARSVVTPTGEDGLANYDPPDTPTFPDVPATYWCYKHVEYCKEHEIVAGYPDGTYQPTRSVTRDQMAVYVQRAFELPL